MRVGRLLFALIATCVAGAGPGSAQQEPSRFAKALQLMAENGIERAADIDYATLPGVDPQRFSLDVYTTKTLSKAPVVLFFHGGGWQRGDKAAVLQKPLALAPAGYVVVSANYRFRPDVSTADMAQDVATAAAWVHKSIAAYGGDPNRIFLMGHSAGAHLVSVVGTNESYLKASGLSFKQIKGVVALDTGPYNVALQVARVRGQSGYGDQIRLVFGEDPALWPAVSPLDNVAPGKGIPPFLIVTSDNRADVAHQAKPFFEALVAASIDAAFFTAPGSTHESLNADLGAQGNKATGVVISFLDKHRGPASAQP